MPVSRFEAEQGVVVRLRVRFERNDALFDPDSIERIEIHRRTGPTDTELVDTIDASEVVQEAQGIFYVDWAIPSDQTVGAYVDRWYFIRDSGDAEEFDDATFGIAIAGTFGSTGIISIDEVRAGYLINSNLSDADIQTLIDQAGEIIYYGTGKNFASPSTTIHVDGTGAPYLILPDAVLEIESIEATEPNCGSSLSSFDPDDYAIKSNWIVSKSFRPMNADPCAGACDLCADPCSGIFPFGHRNIAVTGRFGLYEEIPALIKRAAGLWCKYAGADGTISAPAAANEDSESTQLHSYTRRASDTLAQIHLRGHTGIYEIDHILNLFRATTIRMMVI